MRTNDLLDLDKFNKEKNFEEIQKILDKYIKEEPKEELSSKVKASGLTTDRNDERLKTGAKAEGQNEVYLVMTEEERSKGYVRPVRDSYIHVGALIDFDFEIVRLSPEDIEHFKEFNYVYKAVNLDKESSLRGRYLTEKDFKTLDRKTKRVGGCGVVTKMGYAIAQTYAKNPKYYGATFCVGCNKHLPVNEFFWDKTEEEVGS